MDFRKWRRRNATPVGVAGPVLDFCDGAFEVMPHTGLLFLKNPDRIPSSKKHCRTPEYPFEFSARLVKMPGALNRFCRAPGPHGRPSSSPAVHQPVHAVQQEQYDCQKSPF
jgi:hypothetical protein